MMCSLETLLKSSKTRFVPSMLSVLWATLVLAIPALPFVIFILEQ